MLSDFTLAVRDLVRDKDQVVSPAQFEQAVGEAVLRYSGDRPRTVVEDVTSGGGRRLALPAGWIDGTSRIVSAESPIGDVPASLIEGSIALYQTPTEQLLELPVALAVGDEVRLRYSVPHTVSALVDSVPLSDRQAVCYWAAAIVCDQLAAHYAGDGEPTIGADTVQHQTKSQTWASRAREYRKQYASLIGVDERRGGPAGVNVNWNTTDSRGQPRLFQRWPR